MTSPSTADRRPGEMALVLHTHLPWLAGHGVWPVGEEWLFQAWGHSWLPVTDVLMRLADEGHRDVLTLGVTPMVAAQVADPRLRRDVGTWLGGQMWRAEEQRWHWWLPAAIRDLSHHHWRHHARLLDRHEEVERRGGLLAVWADLQQRGVVELLGGPATHPYLPLVADPAVIGAQLETGLRAHARWAGRRPDGVWAPELGYRPRGTVGDPTRAPLGVDADGTPTLRRGTVEQPGLEELYEQAGVRHVLVDAPTVVRAAGGADRDWTTRPAIAVSGSPEDAVHDGVLVGDSSVVAHARDLSVAYRVWAPDAGYPGDEWYRDFHTQGSFGAHRSHRVTGRDVDWRRKEPYDPERADARTADHVADLHGLLRRVLDPRPGGLVVAAYDTELFGHWWYEGPTFLERLLRAVHADDRVRTTTLRSRLERRPPTRRLALPESSWGYAKGHGSWVTSDTRWMWRRIADLEAAATRAIGRLPPRDVLDEATTIGAAVAQLARELAQLRCSDWPFMVTRGASGQYAKDRVEGHAGAASALIDALAATARDGDRSVAGLRALASQRRALVPVPEEAQPLVAAFVAGSGPDPAP